MKKLAIALLFLAFTSPDIAQAQVVDDHLRLGGYFALGLGGDANTTSGSLSSTAGLEPTLGAGVRIERGVWDYISIGANFEVLTFELDTAGAEREAVIDIDAWVRVRYLIELDRDQLYLEPYIGLPLGFSAGVLQDLDGSGDEIWPGWNTGVLAGAYLLTGNAIGFFVEGGWRYHQLFTNARVAFADIDVRLETHQFAMQIGIVVLGL